jgi:ribose-phosphate pyrophosphokinase
LWRLRMSARKPLSERGRFSPNRAVFPPVQCISAFPRERQASVVAGDLRIFTGNGNRALAQEIAAFQGIPLGNCEVGRFSEGEISVKIGENVRGADVFVIQSTAPPVNDNWMELLIMIDALRRASARRITAVIPFYAYARQDRKDQPRVPITAKLMANLLEASGTSRVLAMDLHADQVQGFFDIPVDHLTAEPVFVKYIRGKGLKNLAVASPDAGGIKQAWSFAEAIKVPLAIVDKRRKGPVETEVLNVIGDVKGCNIVIPDDMMTAGSTMAQAARALKERGAIDIYGCATHPIFSGPAAERLKGSGIKEIIVTNSIPLNENARAMVEPPVTVLSVGNLFGEAIRRIHKEESVSALFR